MPRWQKGQSGNPSGKAKGIPSATDLAQKHTKAMLQVLIGMARDPRTRAYERMHAARAVLAQAQGVVLQPEKTLTDEQLRLLSEQILKERELAEQKNLSSNTELQKS